MSLGLIGAYGAAGAQQSLEDMLAKRIDMLSLFPAKAT